MSPRLALFVLLLAVGAVTSAASAVDSVIVTREVFLMGTRAQLSTAAPTRAHGISLLEQAIRILEAADSELSTWKSTSAISRLNRQPVGSPLALDARLCAMFERVDEWRRATDGAFDPAIGRLIAAWDIHGDGRVPTAPQLAAAGAVSGWRHLAFDAVACTISRQADVLVDVGAFGKGEALDRVGTALGDTAWMIDLGGQVSAGSRGHESWMVSLAHPLDRGRAHLALALREGSLSTSGGSERDLRVDDVRVGHILDPRTGRPAAFTGSVTVWHRQGLAADALSTALYVMGPERGLAWAEARGVSACFLIVDERGAVRTEMTPTFRRLLS